MKLIKTTVLGIFFSIISIACQSNLTPSELAATNIQQCLWGQAWCDDLTPESRTYIYARCTLGGEQGVTLKASSNDCSTLPLGTQKQCYTQNGYTCTNVSGSSKKANGEPCTSANDCESNICECHNPLGPNGCLSNNESLRCGPSTEL